MSKVSRDKKSGRFTGSVGTGKGRVPVEGLPQPLRKVDRKPQAVTDEVKVFAVLVDSRVSDVDVKERMAAAAVSPIDWRVAEVLVGDSDPLVVLQLAQNDSCPKTLFVKFSGHPNVALREAVAGNRYVSGELLNLLSYDVDDKVRLRVAGNPSTPQEVLERLTNLDNSFKVREHARVWFNLHQTPYKLDLFRPPHRSDRG